jgi:hypothetical protein
VTTQADITHHYESGSWRSLAELAACMISIAEQHAKSKLDARLGGGTRLMLALQHRISHGVDLFIRDPQWLGYLTPRLNDRFEHLIDTYEEGSSSLKLLKQKSPAINGVLEQIKNSPQIHANWERILAPNKPALSLAADWAQTQLAEYQSLLA